MRNLKALGLAFLAALALSAVAASAASANVFTTDSESGEVAVSADQTEEGKHVFTVEGSKVECSTANFATDGEVEGGKSTVLVHPKYGGCTAFGFVNSPVHTTGCDFNLDAGEGTTEEVMPVTYTGGVDVECDEGAVIKITAGTCEVQVEDQEGLTDVEYVNQSGDVLVKADVSGIAVNKTKDGFLCPLSGTGAATGSYAGDTLASGTSEEAPVSIGVE